MIDEIINNFKDFHCRISRSTRLDCILSVDAIAFSPDIFLSKDNKIIGLNHNIVYKVKQPFKYYTENIIEWINLVQNHWNENENYAFVYYLQPINPD